MWSFICILPILRQVQQCPYLFNFNFLMTHNVEHLLGHLDVFVDLWFNLLHIFLNSVVHNDQV